MASAWRSRSAEDARNLRPRMESDGGKRDIRNEVPTRSFDSGRSSDGTHDTDAMRSKRPKTAGGGALARIVASLVQRGYAMRKVLVLLLFAASPAWAQETKAVAFVSGNMLHNWFHASETESMARSYVLGAHDALKTVQGALRQGCLFDNENTGVTSG